MEYKRDEFTLVYADVDDASAVGRLEEGDALYVVDENGEDDLKVTMKELRVRLHEISGKPFVDINPKLGMELTFLRPEHGVYVHASRKPTKPVERQDEFATMCGRFQIHMVDKASHRIIYVLRIKSENEMKNFLDIFMDELGEHDIAVDVVAYNSSIRDRGMALKLFNLVAKKRAGVFPDRNLYPEFFDGVDGFERKLTVRFLGVTKEVTSHTFAIEFALV